ncbi:GTPase Era [Eisenibacter elegans]|uniref:GTPase Era n=1 Tax=Eisenibacter elegans TaxID=997 RepID=UPI0006873F32|nr:GTPase Era [Eisenibacter elegans]
MESPNTGMPIDGFPPHYKAGFISIVGKPNVGKSTLMNQLVGERLSIITPKAQTTRHRIMGIISGDEYQLVYSDTPGIIEPKYALHESMMEFVSSALEDADVVLFVVDPEDSPEGNVVVERLQGISTPILVLLNKIDLLDQEKLEIKAAQWQAAFPSAPVLPLSALNGFGTEVVMGQILARIPEHPPFFPPDELSDKTERFFASEIIREKIFELYQQEIPYSCEVVVAAFKEEPDIIRIHSEIWVERDSQKGILIGKKGEALKQVGIRARKSLEAFFGKQIFLELYVKVEPDWRRKKTTLKRLGY